MKRTLTLSDYQSVAEFRYQIRRFLRFSEEAARSAGLKARQYQLLLAIKGLPQELRPTIGELAERLQIQHHSAVELVNRLSAGGYIHRQRANQDRREVLAILTPKGERVLHELVLHHRAELRLRGPGLIATLKHVMRNGKHPDKAANKSSRRQANRKDTDVRK